MKSNHMRTGPILYILVVGLVDGYAFLVNVGGQAKGIVPKSVPRARIARVVQRWHRGKSISQG